MSREDAHEGDERTVDIFLTAVGIFFAFIFAIALGTGIFLGWIIWG